MVSCGKFPFAAGLNLLSTEDEDMTDDEYLGGDDATELALL